MRSYLTIVIAATALLASACASNPLASCAERAQQDTCGNWIPGSEALCYSDGPGPSPLDVSMFPTPRQGQAVANAGCAIPSKDRFGATDAVIDDDGNASWWCCVDMRDGGPVVSLDSPAVAPDATADAHVTGAAN